MVADADLNITYVNLAVVPMLEGIQTDLRKHLPNFDVRTLVETYRPSPTRSPNSQRPSER